MMKAMLPITPQLEGQHLPQNTQTFPTKAPCAFPPVSQLPPGYLSVHLLSAVTQSWTRILSNQPLHSPQIVKLGSQRMSFKILIIKWILSPLCLDTKQKEI